MRNQKYRGKIGLYGVKNILRLLLVLIKIKFQGLKNVNSLSVVPKTKNIQPVFSLKMKLFFKMIENSHSLVYSFSPYFVHTFPIKQGCTIARFIVNLHFLIF